MAFPVRFGVIGLVLFLGTLTALPHAEAQAPPQRPASELQPGPIPRLASGKPNFQGSWFKWTPPDAPRVSDVTGQPLAPRAGEPPRDPNVFRVHGARLPYRAEAWRERKWLHINEHLDGEPKCHLPGVPRGALAPPYPFAIIQNEKEVAILFEYAHQPQIVPMNNAPLSGARTWAGESRGHWEGDTLVIETTNFNGRTYMSYNEPISENARAIERFTMTGPNTYNYNATIIDPQTYTEPYVVNLIVARQPEKDQLLMYDCLEGEMDLAHYAPTAGGTAGLDLIKQPAAIYGCLRAQPDGKGDFTYTVTPLNGKSVRLAPAATLKSALPPLMDREVKFDGRWVKRDAAFAAVYAHVNATGCRWDGK